MGGIAGASWGSIRDSWSKGHLSGGDYVGGVAGRGATIVDCHTLVEIDQGSACLGAVAGAVDDQGSVSGNTFTSEGLGGLDGISYAGRAEPVTFDVLCATAGAPERFSQLELTFMAEGRMVAVIPFRYGTGIESLPEIPPREGYSAAWPEMDYAHLTASQTLEAVYTPYFSALTDGGELPELLVEGSFSSQAAMRHTMENAAWTDGNGKTHNGLVCSVTVEDPEPAEIAYTVHVRLPDQRKSYTLWVQGADGWTQTEYRTDGQYLLLDLDSRSSTVVFALAEQAGISWLWSLAAAGGLLLLIAAFCRIRRTRQGSSHGREGGDGVLRRRRKEEKAQEAK